ncbi:MAG: hypothetical protein GX089_01210 [Fibrobacter sp.]|nr:hypothetical protein [Fibrobacter sp.]
MKLTQLFSSVVLITVLTQYSQAEGKSGSALALTPVFPRPAIGITS